MWFYLNQQGDTNVGFRSSRAKRTYSNINWYGGTRTHMCRILYIQLLQLKFLRIVHTDLIDIHHLLSTAKLSISIESQTNYAPKTLGSCTCEDRYPFNNIIMTTTSYNLYIFSNHSANLMSATKPLLHCYCQELLAASDEQGNLQAICCLKTTLCDCVTVLVHVTYKISVNIIICDRNHFHFGN